MERKIPRQLPRRLVICWDSVSPKIRTVQVRRSHLLLIASYNTAALVSLLMHAARLSLSLANYITGIVISSPQFFCWQTPSHRKCVLRACPRFQCACMMGVACLWKCRPKPDHQPIEIDWVSWPPPFQWYVAFTSAQSSAFTVTSQCQLTWLRATGIPPIPSVQPLLLIIAALGIGDASTPPLYRRLAIGPLGTKIYRSVSTGDGSCINWWCNVPSILQITSWSTRHCSIWKPTRLEDLLAGNCSCTGNCAAVAPSN